MAEDNHAGVAAIRASIDPTAPSQPSGWTTQSSARKIRIMFRSPLRSASLCALSMVTPPFHLEVYIEIPPAKIALDLLPRGKYVPPVQKGNASTFDSPHVRFLLRMPLPRSFANYICRKLFRFLLTIQGLGAFAIITIGVMLRKIRVARHVIWPLMFHETARAGLRLLPMFL